MKNQYISNVKDIKGVISVTVRISDVEINARHNKNSTMTYYTPI